MQFPLGQSEAWMAEHCPMQLVPRPQVTLVRLLSRAQQPTLIDSLENVKAESKKSTSVVVALSLKIFIRIYSVFHHISISQELPSFIEEHFISPISILRWRIEPTSGEDDGLPE